MIRRGMAVALAVAMVAGALAQQVSVKFYNENPGGGSFTVTTGSTNLNASAGVLNNAWSLGYNTSGTTNAFSGYCTTPFVYIGSQSNPWNADRMLSTGLGAVGGQIGWLAAQLKSGGVYTGTADQHAAIQIAIWRLMGSTVTGNNAASIQLVTDSNTWLANSANQSAGYIFYQAALDETGKPISQDLVEAVPEPFTLMLGASALGLAIVKRRRSKSA